MPLMGLFGKTALKPRPTVVHVAEVPIKRPGTIAKPGSASHQDGTPRRDSGRGPPRVSSMKRTSSEVSTTSNLDRDSARLQLPQANRNSKKRSATSPVAFTSFDPDSEDDGSTTSWDQPPNKKQATSRAVDKRRRLRSHQAFSDGDGGSFSYIRAKDIASLSLKAKRALCASEDDNLAVQLQYPSASQPEDYELVWTRDGLDPIEEIIKVVTNVANHYLTPDQARPFDKHTGILRSLDRAKNQANNQQNPKNTVADFRNAVNKYNAALKALREDGTLAKNLDKRHDVPLELVSCILTQIYDRAVTPQVDTLRKYENGTDNVYGELKSGFLSRIFTETNLTSEHVFVDLGSGVGNVVLQAALEIGCESWGCEMMDNASKLAMMQEREFAARCRLWGIAPGRVKLRHNNFMEDAPTLKALRKADVVLVNNQAFTPDLNDKLKLLFLELKDGCRIVSLKSLVADQNSRNANDVTSNLSVERKEYYSGSVSWTDVGGYYYIATKGGRRGQSYDSSS